MSHSKKLKMLWRHHEILHAKLTYLSAYYVTRPLSMKFSLTHKLVDGQCLAFIALAHSLFQMVCGLCVHQNTITPLLALLSCTVHA